MTELRGPDARSWRIALIQGPNMSALGKRDPELFGSIKSLEDLNAAVADEVDKLLAEGVLRDRPDWLAVIVRRRLYVAFGARAVQQLSRELRSMGAM